MISSPSPSTRSQASEGEKKTALQGGASVNGPFLYSRPPCCSAREKSSHCNRRGEASLSTREKVWLHCAVSRSCLARRAAAKSSSSCPFGAARIEGRAVGLKEGIRGAASGSASIIQLGRDTKGGFLTNHFLFFTLELPSSPQKKSAFWGPKRRISETRSAKCASAR